MDKVGVCEFSPAGHIFAHSSAGTVKFWNVNTGNLEHQYQPAEYLSATTSCMRYCPKDTSNSNNEPLQEYLNNGQIIALGTVSGKILLYNTAQHELAYNLEHSKGYPIVDMLWTVSNKGVYMLISLASDKTLVKWDVNQRVKLASADVAANGSICQIGTNLYLNAGMCLQIVKLSKKEAILHETTSCAQPIFRLYPVKLPQDKVSQYIISLAKDDRFVNIWSVHPSLSRIASFQVGDFVIDAAYTVNQESTLILAVTTKKGYVKLFKHHLNGKISNKKPVKSYSKLSVKSESSASNKGSSSMEIMCCSFISKDTLQFAYSPDFPVCEKISISQLEKDVTLVRIEPRLRHREDKEGTLMNTVTPIVSNKAFILSGEPALEDNLEQKTHGKKRKQGDKSISLPLEECLDALAIKQPTFSAPLHNNVQLLVQGLHSKDERLLQSILVKGADDELVENTVKRLPVQCIAPFLNYLKDAMNKGAKNLHYLKWLKSILHHHMSFMSTMTSKKALMEPFYSVCSARISTLPEVTKLHSRLSLILTHISARHENAETDHNPAALITYRDESDEESERENRGSNRLPSESEDFWDDLPFDDKDEESMEEDNEEQDEIMVNGGDHEMEDFEDQEMKKKEESFSEDDMVEDVPEKKNTKSKRKSKSPSTSKRKKN